MKQRDGNGIGARFDVVEKDKAHDLALCKIKDVTAKKSDLDKPTDHPITALDVSSETIQQGQFIAIEGFPLGSWNPTLQLGTIAATETVNPNESEGVPAGQKELIQVSVSGNMGNSGSPVISLRTGKVIVQAVPSPLWSAQAVPIKQNSGIMLAVPALWIHDLLTRNHVSSLEHKAKERLVGVLGKPK
jgi:S1-C subfamily serine protease